MLLRLNHMREIQIRHIRDQALYRDLLDGADQRALGEILADLRARVLILLVSVDSDLG